MAIAEIYVSLKPTLLDAQGTTVLKALRQLGHAHAQDVRIGKFITIQFDDALSPVEMQAHLELACRDLLANPVIEDYRISIPGAADGTPTPNSPSVLPASLPSVAASDVVPNPQPMASSAAASAGAQPAQVTAARITSPQTVEAAPIVQSVAQAVTQTVVTQTAPAAPEPISLATPATVAPAVGASPFLVSYDEYLSLTADERLALQGRAWQEHGAWIGGELESRRAQWILCVGSDVMQSGETLDDYPDERRLDVLGRANDLVPWVFTRAPQD